MFGISSKTTTLIFMAVVLLAIVIYDSLVALNRIKGDTISEITLVWAMNHPISVFCLGVALGVVFGHLFWAQLVYLDSAGNIIQK